MSIPLSSILGTRKKALKLTKMVCTIGPASNKVSVLTQLLNSGMNVCRLNFSHGTHEMHANQLATIRKTSQQLPLTLPPGIMLDTKGPEIRTGNLADPSTPINLQKGKKIRLTSDYSILCDENIISFSYVDLFDSLNVNSKILMADGNLSLIISEKDLTSKTLIAIIQNDYLLGAKKNVNLPGVKINLPVISSKDQTDLIDFGLRHDIDFVALSFTTTAQCVKMCRDLLGNQGKHLKIIAKIDRFKFL